ncbi:MAG: TolC family protein [Phycisphaerae bacterium]|nr:TolC family protein [Phycisphaerae bacterium]
MNTSNDGLRRIAGFRCLGVLFSLVLATAGCGTPQVHRSPQLAALGTKLDAIETTQLAEQSKSPPVSIGQATEKLATQIVEPNEAQRVVRLSLDEVRAAALANNLDLKVERIDPAIAQQSLDAERAKFESIFYGSAGYSRSKSKEGDTDSARTYEAGVSTPLQTGGTITASLPVSDSDGVTQAAASVSVVQSLLKGAGTRANLYSIQLAAHQKDRVDAATKLRAISILSTADVYYWYLYAARKELDVSREQYKLTQNQLKNARHKVEAGSAPKYEIILAEAGLASCLDSMISAETSVRNCERDLKRIMNRADLPLDGQIDLIPTTDPNPQGLDLDKEALVAAALANRMELVDLEYQLAANEIGVEVAKNDLLPELDLSYRLSAGGQAADEERALENIFDDNSTDHRVGLAATIPLGNRAAKARLREARLERVRTALNRELQEQQIRQEVYEAVDGLEQNWRRILAAEQGVVRADRSYRVEQLRFQLGQRTSVEVLDAASNLADAQLRKISAFASYEIAQIYLARATGTLLGYGRICLEPYGSALP